VNRPARPPRGRRHPRPGTRNRRPAYSGGGKCAATATITAGQLLPGHVIPQRHERAPRHSGAAVTRPGKKPEEHLQTAQVRVSRRTARAPGPRFLPRRSAPCPPAASPGTAGGSATATTTPTHHPLQTASQREPPARKPDPRSPPAAVRSPRRSSVSRAAPVRIQRQQPAHPKRRISILRSGSTPRRNRHAAPKHPPPAQTHEPVPAVAGHGLVTTPPITRIPKIYTGNGHSKSQAHDHMKTTLTVIVPSVRSAPIGWYAERGGRGLRLRLQEQLSTSSEVNCTREWVRLLAEVVRRPLMMGL